MLRRIDGFTYVASAALWILSAVAYGQPSSHWAFDGDATDSAGSRDLTLQGATAFSASAAPGFGGTSLDLSAGGNGATYDVMGADSISGSYTVSMWVNPTAGSGSTGTFFGTRSGSDQSFDVKFQNPNTVHGDIGTGSAWLDTSADITNFDYQGGQWQHVAYSVQPGSYTAYVNGVARSTEAFGAGAPLLFDATHDIAIGAARVNLSENFDGLVDEVKVFNSALTQSQVQQAMVPDGYERIPDLFSTGVDSTGTPLGGGVADPHYSLTVDPSGLGAATVPADGFPIPPWIGNDSTSAWIGPDDGNDANGPPGSYTYETTFSLANFDPDEAVINGLVATDNDLLDILLNGTSTGISSSGFADFVPFSIDSGFASDTNTLQFVVNNGAPTGPTGLRVSLSGFAQAAVPEPTSIALWSLLGLAGVGFGWFRWKKQRTI